MQTKYIVKQDKSTGKWCIYQREWNKKNKANDKFIQIVEYGIHTACIICETMNRMEGYTNPLTIDD